MRQEVADLRDDGSVFSNEKALMCLYNPEKDDADTIDKTASALFQNSSLAACTEQSKFIVIQRIKAIQKIHKIRQIFAQQCFIGIVGLQDAGKTTLLKKVSEIKHTFLFCILFKILFFLYHDNEVGHLFADLGSWWQDWSFQSYRCPDDVRNK